MQRLFSQTGERVLRVSHEDISCLAGHLLGLGQERDHFGKISCSRDESKKAPTQGYSSLPG